MKIVNSIEERNALERMVLSVAQDDGTWLCYENWKEVPPALRPRPPSPEELQAAVLAQYDGALMALFNRVAFQKNYSSYITVAMRAGYAGPFQKQGLAFVAWMEGCNVLGYQLIADVKAGRKPLPTVEEFIESLPPMVWPEE